MTTGKMRFIRNLHGITKKTLEVLEILAVLPEFIIVEYEGQSVIKLDSNCNEYPQLYQMLLVWQMNGGRYYYIPEKQLYERRENMTTGERIMHIRNERGISQKQLSEMCGLSEPAIRNYELANRKPSALILDKIAAALAVTAAELVLPELLDELEKAGLEITIHDDEPVICVKGDNPQLEKLLKEYAASK